MPECNRCKAQTYKQAVLDCIDIMSHLYDIYGENPKVESVYVQFCESAKKLYKKED